MRNNKGMVSVIITSYNSEKFLERSVFSVLNQTYKNLELIVVDDCSIDSSKKIVKKIIKQDKRVKFFETKTNSGIASTPRNLGISKAKGKHIAFLDADDYWNIKKLAYQMKYINNFGFSFTAANYQSENSLKKSNFLINYARIFLQIFFLYFIKKNGHYWLYIYNPFLISSALIRKNVINNYKFDPNISKREDLTFWMHIFKKRHYDFLFHSKMLLTISRRKNSVTSNKVEELNKIINSICDNFLVIKNFDKYNYFLIGIALRVLKLIISKIYAPMRRFAYFFVFIFSFFYFFIFYSPLFWNIGNNLIYYSQQKQTEAVFVLSGHQGFNYWNNSYQLRYADVIHYLDIYNSKKNTKFFLLGKLSAIPEQKVLESLLLAEGVPQNNIFVIYDEYQNTETGLKLLKRELDRKNISSFTLITSPYHSLRLSRIGKKFFGDKYDLVFFKNMIMPLKNNYFEKSYNKKEIIYELLANFKQRFF